MGIRASRDLLSLTLGLALSITATVQAQAGPRKAGAAETSVGQATPPAPDLPPPSPDPANQMKTSDQVKRESVQGAVTAPLRDFNVVRTDIPEILIAAMSDPYARPPAKATCRQLIALIMPLDEALGPDIDRLPGTDPTMTERGRSTALGLGADLASGAIPFRGVVRRVTGAAAHDRRVQDAIVAGSVRRAYLKGLGETRGCGPPATPSHQRTAAPQVIPEASRITPRYPARAGSAEPQKNGESSPVDPRKSRP